jgi:2-oxoglutarate ferredoxin oxidoreductase subunit alpha
MPTPRENYLMKVEGQKRFLQGDEACSYGAIYGGCTFFGGYPITPASEIAEVLARQLPLSGGYYVQFEDEIASIAAVVGAAWAGARAMTATSGPGFSLMQENIGYAVMTETPCVIIDVQRSGPSTGQATKAAQGDIMQARWGTHGDHNIIALSPNSSQECLEMTIECFNLAERYRTPVYLMTDGEIGHIRENVTFPRVKDAKLLERRKCGADKECFGGELVPPMKEIGDGLNVHITGSTHKANGMRDVSSQKVHDDLIRRIYAKIDDNREKIVKVEVDKVKGAKRSKKGKRIGMMSYGASSRPAYGAVLRARNEGIPIDHFRFKTIWPFPRRQVAEFAKDLDVILFPEMNLGQLNREVERFVDSEVVPISKIGGISHTLDEIMDVVGRYA